MKLFFWVTTASISILDISSCNHPYSNQNITKIQEITNYRYDTLFNRNDTIVISQMVDSGKACILSWGIHDKFMNKSKDTLLLPHSRFNDLYKEGDYFIVKDGCGTACNYLYLLIFRKQNSGKLFLYPLLFSSINKLIVFQDGTSENLVSIENIETGKRFNLNKPFDLRIHPYSEAIDTVFLRNSNLFIDWRSPSGKKESTSIAFKKVID